MNIRVPLTLFALCAVCLAATARADEVTLANGDHLTGKVQSIDGSAIVLDTEWGGTLTVQRDAVQSVRTDGVLNLVVDGEQLHRARLAISDSGEQAVVTDAGEREVGFGAVQRAAVDVLPSATKDEWKTQVSYGLNISTGNSDTQAHSLRADTTLRRGALRHEGIAQLDRKIDDNTVTKDQMRFGYQLDWFFRDDWYAYGTTEYFKDDLKDVDYRVTLGAGAGHQFWDDTLGALSAEAGVSEVLEQIGGKSETNPAARFAVDYNRFLYGKRLEFFNKDELLVLADLDRGQILNASTGLRLRISSLWTADLRVDLNHETKPAPGQVKTDLTYILGVGFNF